MNRLKTITIMCAIITTMGATAQPSEVKSIESTITSFSKAGDNNNAIELEKYLDNNYRVVMNQLFGSTEVSVMPKSVYVEKVKTKEYGGDTRKLTIQNVLVNGNTASAKVTFAGSKMTFISIILLVKDKDGSWKLISDTPVIG